MPQTLSEANLKRSDPQAELEARLRLEERPVSGLEAKGSKILVQNRFSPQALRAQRDIFYSAACLREAASAKAGEMPTEQKELSPQA